MPPYGQMFSKGEVILVYIQNEPAFFARVEEVRSDVKRGWWQLTFLILSIPLKKMTWILDDDQVRGAEFTMGGTPVRIERVVEPKETIQPQTSSSQESAPEKKQDKEGGARILSLFDDED